ncbi:bifunctional UDP-N-acetylmuramoyl-tripeptide:D-alanyl-D-alanine ligase/alanine racemase [Flavihumibacter sp. CACIAM 22H1]|uniref:bifunctional UDP-N-acetylmuramoyl-tripeptide:D-alanyl-D-alanine ligase/alanine racemase n=1 Tax=Flavihumibacter sp. CACIAM 22H1 TaxID=1812911 RepID=UPI0007A8D383|nr:bifunctional UDP-N-acetylmuramoyl-tripeptide:D-alanyl-D-alanine ligase/alanine racemase [Flavihumibacter sp. CACIAM 22H1]KYP16649.1 MAG: bifunctional UDP-N-acetylmuramoyl-tripeptide:D-alanyl-D-alanine ligase/alanine racemase [Flavihumibacter sp. CACIAM 22H1]
MYRIAEIASIVHARWLQKAENSSIQHLLNDSRKLLFPESTVFFALVSGSRNGHQFIPALYQQGVRNFLVSEEQDPAVYPGANLLWVPDTVQALQVLAEHHRTRFSIPVLAITGSNGKTTVKEWLNQLLEPDFSIIRSPRSYNSQIGVPLSVWLMNEGHQLAIFEAGISRRGEMKKLQQILQPSIGIFTNLGLAHSEGFESMEEKLAEKWQLFQACPLIITHFQEDWINDYIETHLQPGQQLLRWGQEAAAELKILSLEKKEEATQVQLLYNEKEFRLDIPFSNEAAVENALTAALVMLALDIAIPVIQQRMAMLHAISMRLELKEGINQCSVINDSYSADISSLVIALDFLAQQQQHAKKTVLLSDIPETGWAATQLYERVAALLHHHGVSRLIGVGTAIAAHKELFQAYGIPELQFFEASELLLQHWDELSFREETILVKGARRFQFERISAQLEKQVHQTVMEINLNAMLQNLKWYQQRLHTGTRLMAMVKAFSYGSGSYEIANLLQFHGVDYLAVAYTDEGVALRKAGIHLPIMVMNVAPPGFETLVEHNLEPVLFSVRLFRAFDAFIRQEGIPQYPVHLEVETGMNRLGFSLSELPFLLEHLPSTACKVQSVFSHLAASEDPAFDAFTRQQVERFEVFTNGLKQVITYPFLRHIENTSGIFRHPQWQFDMVRLGIGLYGFDAAMGETNQLEEVSTLVTTIAQIKELEAGESVGYGRRGKILRPTTIATIRLGYADGYPRSLGNGAGWVLLKGSLVPTIGSVCMDMTMIDISGVPGVREGDPVTVFGKGLPVAKLAEWAGTIPYEILTGISQRVKRIYYQE